MVPEYVAGALATKEVVHAATADMAEAAYDALLRKYSEHMKNAKAEPVIIVRFGYFAKDEEGREIKRNEHSFFNASDLEIYREVSIGYTLAFRVNGHIHRREVDQVQVNPAEEWPWPSGHKNVDRVGHRLPSVPGITLNYTPELHARLDAVVAALNQAAQTLHGLGKAKDPGAALLALGGLLLSAPKET